MYFGEYGDKLKSKTATGFISARNKIDKYLAKHPNHSAVMTHILWNSKDKNDKWGYKHDTGQCDVSGSGGHETS